jgi:glycosyltransferase involved in cell wall biosynthesis
LANPKYILITSAHNEAELIGNTIDAVINQQLKPVEWIIIDDGSSDNTYEFVRKFADRNSFIKLFKKEPDANRDFSSKVNAIHLAVSKITISDYDYLGILDADITFDSAYYASVISKFENRKKLGIVGGLIYDLVNGKTIPLYLHPNITRGAVQFFKRECYEDVGGLLPLKYGGEDSAACFSARLKGWEVENFGDLIGYHHRLAGTADRNIFKARFREGFVEYHLGYHPLFEFVKGISRFKEQPIIIGSIVRFFGYWLANLKREKRYISKELINFIRKEQIKRLIKTKSNNFVHTFIII